MNIENPLHGPIDILPVQSIGFILPGLVGVSRSTTGLYKRKALLTKTSIPLSMQLFNLFYWSLHIFLFWVIFPCVIIYGFGFLVQPFETVRSPRLEGTRLEDTLIIQE